MKKTILGLAAVAAFTCAPSIHAAVTQQLSICDGSNDCLMVDQDGNFTTTGIVEVTAGNITVDGAGEIQVDTNKSGVVCIGTTAANCAGTNAFKINSASSFGLADSIPPQLQDEESLDTDSSGTGKLSIEYTDTTYTNLTAQLLLSGSESTVNTPGTSVTMTAFGANGSAIPATGLIGSLTPLTGASSNDSGVFTNPYTGPTATLSSLSTIVFSGAGTFNTTFDIGTVSPVPEPGSVVFLGTLILGVTGIARKRITQRI
jgi:hypothetical protein